MAISEEGRKTRFEQWEKLGLESVRHGLLNDPLGTIGGSPEVRELAREWVRMKEAEEAKLSEKREDVVTLKPGIWGMNVNFNEVWRRIRRRFQER